MRNLKISWPILVTSLFIHEFYSWRLMKTSEKTSKYLLFSRSSGIVMGFTKISNQQESFYWLCFYYLFVVTPDYFPPSLKINERFSWVGKRLVSVKFFCVTTSGSYFFSSGGNMLNCVHLSINLVWKI